MSQGQGYFSHDLVSTYKLADSQDCTFSLSMLNHVSPPRTGSLTWRNFGWSVFRSVLGLILVPTVLMVGLLKLCSNFIENI